MGTYIIEMDEDDKKDGVHIILKNRHGLTLLKAINVFDHSAPEEVLAEDGFVNRNKLSVDVCLEDNQQMRFLGWKGGKMIEQFSTEAKVGCLEVTDVPKGLRNGTQIQASDTGNVSSNVDM